MDEIYARNTVARHIVAEALRLWATNGEGYLDSSSFPEIGEDDWHRIEAEVLMLSINFRPPKASVESALKFLSYEVSRED